MSFTWVRLQSEVSRWAEKNFPESPPQHQIWGLVEELGELAHAHLKGQQGIRGSAEKHAAAARDAIADSFIFFMHACSNLGWASQEILRTASPEEFQRTFSVPKGRSPIARTLKGLSNLVEQIELAETSPTAIEKDVHGAAAWSAALFYLSGLAAYCTEMGWSLQSILDEVWPKVRARDWTKNKLDGESAAGARADSADPSVVDVAIAALNHS